VVPQVPAHPVQDHSLRDHCSLGPSLAGPHQITLQWDPTFSLCLQ
jgi:hypothetical protein